MIFAVIGDIDAQAAPLQAVLQRIDAEGILTVLHTGNSLVGGPEPAAVFALLNARGIPSVLGPKDKLLTTYERKAATLRGRLDEHDLDALAGAAAALTPTQLEAIKSRPRIKTLQLEERAVLLSHASPLTDRDSVDEDTPLNRLQRIREAHPVDIVVCGGAQDPWSRLVDGTLFLNAGRLIQDGRAQFALVDTDSDPASVTFADLPLD